MTAAHQLRSRQPLNAAALPARPLSAADEVGPATKKPRSHSRPAVAAESVVAESRLRKVRYSCVIIQCCFEYSSHLYLHSLRQRQKQQRQRLFNQQDLSRQEGVNDYYLVQLGQLLNLTLSRLVHSSLLRNLESLLMLSVESIRLHENAQRITVALNQPSLRWRKTLPLSAMLLSLLHLH